MIWKQVVAEALALGLFIVFALPSPHLGFHLAWYLENVRMVLRALTVPRGPWTVLVAQSCPALCNPMDCSRSGSSVHGILQAGIQEWVTIPFSGDFPNLGIKPRSPALQADSLPSEPPGKPYVYMLIPASSYFIPSLTFFSWSWPAVWITLSWRVDVIKYIAVCPVYCNCWIIVTSLFQAIPLKK